MSQDTSINRNLLKPTQHIVGGQPTEIEAIPYQAQVQFFGAAVCGGSIISEKWVLSAAHCVYFSPILYIIRVGTSFVKKGGTVHWVQNIIQHPNYTIDKFKIPRNDISLFLLSSPIQMDSTRQPIPLFNHEEKVQDGAECVLSGWGRLEEGGAVPKVLQSVTVPIVPIAKCVLSYPNLNQAELIGQICAGYPEGNKAACHGDSGGPLAINGRLAGIASWGIGCGRPGFPTVYTEVAAHRAWISATSGV